MTALVIHAPKWKVQQESARSFEGVMASGVGDGYAIPKSSAQKLYVGCDVVLLSNDERKRAEGKLRELVPTSKTGSGMQRYNVHIVNLNRVPFMDERLTRTGIAVID